MPEIIEQLVEQHDHVKNVDTTLRRSTRIKKSVIPSDYVVYLEESDYNIGAENCNDPPSTGRYLTYILTYIHKYLAKCSGKIFFFFIH